MSEPEPEPEESEVRWSTQPPARKIYRIKTKTVCRSGKEFYSPVIGSLRRGAEVTGLEEKKNSEGVLRIRTAKGWISHKPNILEQIAGGYKKKRIKTKRRKYMKRKSMKRKSMKRKRKRKTKRKKRKTIKREELIGGIVRDTLRTGTINRDFTTQVTGRINTKNTDRAGDTRSDRWHVERDLAQKAARESQKNGGIRGLFGGPPNPAKAAQQSNISDIDVRKYAGKELLRGSE